MARGTSQNRSVFRRERTLTVHLPPLYRKQKQAVFNDSRISIVEASTKSGKTVACIAWLAMMAMLHGGENLHFWWVAPIYGQAEIAFRRMKRYLPRQIYTANESKLTLKLGNGATIWFKSAEKPDSLYGEDVQAAVVDEASRCKEESWNALLSTLTQTNGPIRIIGNVKGRRNWFYRLARRVKGGDEPGMIYHCITAADAIASNVIALETVMQAKRLLPLNVFRELYLCIPSDDGGNPFGQKYIERCIGPMSQKPPIVWGWDLAKSYDWTVGIGLDEDGAVAGFHRFQMSWNATIARIRAITGDSFALVDSTGVGDPVLEALQNPQPVWLEREPENSDDPWESEIGEPYLERFRAWRDKENFEGYKFNQSSKQQLMESLAVAIQSGEVCYPTGQIVEELQEFEYEYTRTGVRYSATEGMHDDCVCALALAHRARQLKPAGATTW